MNHQNSENTEDQNTEDRNKEDQKKEDRKTKADSEALKKKKKKKGSTIVLDILIVLLVGVLCFSGYKLIQIYQRYHANTVSQNKVSDIFYAQQSSSPEESSSVSASGHSGSGTLVTENEYTQSYTLNALVEQNPDTVGWIKIPDTPVDYAVMQGESNDEYLHTDFFNEYNFAGIPFMDYTNTIGASYQNYIIYGHRMADHSMFWALGEFLDQEFYDSHTTFQLLLRVGDEDILYDCEIFSVYLVSVYDNDWITTFPDEESYQDYITMCQNKSSISTDVEVSSSDQIVTLSTCAAYGAENEGRLLVHAKMTPRVVTPVTE